MESWSVCGAFLHTSRGSWRACSNSEHLDVTIHELQNNIRHLARMCDVPVDDPIKQLGLTDAIRYVIGNYGKPITPVEVRDQLLRWYCKHDDYRNLLASVHTVMKRVERAGEITFDGTRAVWTGGPRHRPSSVISLPEETFTSSKGLLRSAFLAGVPASRPQKRFDGSR